MPTYEYRCPKCGEFELVQKITEDALKTCPTCGSTVERLVSAAAFHLKGSGWYKTDYGGSTAKSSSSSTAEKSADKPDKSADTASASSATEKSSTPADSKPAEKSSAGNSSAEKSSAASD